MDATAIKARLCDNILAVMQGQTIGKRKAEAIVGGRARLRLLMEKGLVRYEKASPSKTGKWQCNAADVLRHCKNEINQPPFKSNI